MIYSLDRTEKMFVIVGAGSLASGDLLFEKRPGDIVAAADAGYLYLKEQGIRPDLIIGDFDSSEEPDTDIEIIELPVEKDDTDIVYCVREGFRRGYNNFLILGALGGERISHTMANIQLLSMIYARGGRAELRYGNQALFVLGEGEKIAFDKNLQGHFSVFSLTEKSLITLKNLYYPLEKGEIIRSFPLGVSNHFTGKKAEVILHKGEILIIIEET